MDTILSTGTIWTTAKPINATFEPLADITAYELARILRDVHGQPLYEADWQALGPAITRHFKRIS